MSEVKHHDLEDGTVKCRYCDYETEVDPEKDPDRVIKGHLTHCDGYSREGAEPTPDVPFGSLTDKQQRVLLARAREPSASMAELQRMADVSTGYPQMVLDKYGEFVETIEDVEEMARTYGHFELFPEEEAEPEEPEEPTDGFVAGLTLEQAYDIINAQDITEETRRAVWEQAVGR